MQHVSWGLGVWHGWRTRLFSLISSAIARGSRQTGLWNGLRGIPFLDIGEVAKRSGVPLSALRYYEEVGLIRSISRLDFGDNSRPTFS